MLAGIDAKPDSKSRVCQSSAAPPGGSARLWRSRRVAARLSACGVWHDSPSSSCAMINERLSLTLLFPGSAVRRSTPQYASFFRYAAVCRSMPQYAAAPPVSQYAAVTSQYAAEVSFLCRSMPQYARFYFLRRRVECCGVLFFATLLWVFFSLRHFRFCVVALVWRWRARCRCVRP
jgi:hypothetical protein